MRAPAASALGAMHQRASTRAASTSSTRGGDADAMFERDVDVSNGVVGRQIGAAREDDAAKNHRSRWSGVRERFGGVRAVPEQRRRGRGRRGRRGRRGGARERRRANVHVVGSGSGT